MARVLHPSGGAALAVSHSRIPFTNISGRTCTELQTFYANWTYSAVLESGSTSTATVRAAIEYPSGTFTALTTDGTTRDTIIAGGQNVSAPLRATGLNIPNGAVFWIRTRCLVTGGDGFMARNYQNGVAFEGGTIQGFTSVTNDGNDFTVGGTQTTNAGAAYGPMAVCSNEIENKVRSFALFGDSIMRGNFSNFISFGEVGTVGAGYTYLNLSFSGAKFVDGGNQNPARRIALARAAGCTDVIMNYPINDISSGTTNATIQTAMTNLWTNLKSGGFSRIVQATCTHRTIDGTSPGTPMTTPAGAYTGGTSSFRSLMNTWIRGRTLGTSSTPDTIFEMADTLETARDSGLWLNPTVNVQSDGLHPSVTGSTTSGNALTARLLATGY